MLNRHQCLHDTRTAVDTSILHTRCWVHTSVLLSPLGRFLRNQPSCHRMAVLDGTAAVTLAGSDVLQLRSPVRPGKMPCRGQTSMLHRPLCIHVATYEIMRIFYMCVDVVELSSCMPSRKSPIDYRPFVTSQCRGPWLL